jgi:hypothetical protein
MSRKRVVITSADLNTQAGRQHWSRGRMARHLQTAAFDRFYGTATKDELADLAFWLEEQTAPNAPVRRFVPTIVAGLINPATLSRQRHYIAALRVLPAAMGPNLRKRATYAASRLLDIGSVPALVEVAACKLRQNHSELPMHAWNILKGNNGNERVVGRLLNIQLKHLLKGKHGDRIYCEAAAELERRRRKIEK